MLFRRLAFHRILSVGRLMDESDRCLYHNAQLNIKKRRPSMTRRLAIGAMLALVIPSSEYIGQQISAEASACEALMEAPNVTITYARLKAAVKGVPEYCYVQGSISGRIRFMMQLPLPRNW